MISETKEIQISIKKREGLQILNALNKSIDIFEQDDNMQAAIELKELLSSNFVSSKIGVNFIK